ncbi:MAG: hypothetical protein JNJ46_28110 [Myxococcales bacterium]|nr:hypothetical protein [Myxococcales bacterium]
MIQSVNATSTTLGGGVIVAAGGTPDTLASFPPGKPLNVSSVAIPAGRAGTLLFKYGAGTLPHSVTVQVSDLVNPFPRTLVLNISGPGSYVVEHRVVKVLAISTRDDPKGPLDVQLQWRAVPATDGARGILGALDIRHPQAKPGEPLFIKTTEQATLHLGVASGFEPGDPVLSDDKGHARAKRAGDEGDSVGTFISLEGDDARPLVFIHCRPKRG